MFTKIDPNQTNGLSQDSDKPSSLPNASSFGRLFVSRPRSISQSQLAKDNSNDANGDAPHPNTPVTVRKGFTPGKNFDQEKYDRVDTGIIIHSPTSQKQLSKRKLQLDPLDSLLADAELLLEKGSVAKVSEEPDCQFPLDEEEPGNISPRR